MWDIVLSIRGSHTAGRISENFRKRVVWEVGAYGSLSPAKKKIVL
jgi:hypothetical protein